MIIATIWVNAQYSSLIEVEDAMAADDHDYQWQYFLNFTYDFNLTDLNFSDLYPDLNLSEFPDHTFPEP